jgi:hypothetical protein
VVNVTDINAIGDHDMILDRDSVACIDLAKSSHRAPIADTENNLSGIGPAAIEPHVLANTAAFADTDDARVKESRRTVN